MFYHNCHIVFLEHAGHEVKVVTDTGGAPGRENCNYIRSQVIPRLISQERVYLITYVKASDPSVETVYFDRQHNIRLGDTAAAISGMVGIGANIESGTLKPVGSAFSNGWKSFSGLWDDHKKKKSDPGVETDVLTSPIGALPPPASNPVPEDEPSVIPTTGETPSLQGSSLTDETSGTESAMGGNPGNSKPDQVIGTNDITQRDDKMAYDASSDTQSLFQGRRRRLRRHELRRRLDDQCFSCVLSAADYIAAQDQSQAAQTPPATNSAPPPKLDGFLPNAIAYVQKDSSTLATVQVTQYAQDADGIYPLDISILDQDGNMINNVQNQKASPGTKIEVQIPWDTQLSSDSSLIGGQKFILSIFPRARTPGILSRFVTKTLCWLRPVRISASRSIPMMRSERMLAWLVHGLIPNGISNALLQYFTLFDPGFLGARGRDSH